MLGPLDLILSKACRADEGDLEDIRFLLAREAIDIARLESALDRAMVPPAFAEVYPAYRARLLALEPR